MNQHFNKRYVQYIESDGAFLPVVMTGTNTKKIILFVHGGPGLSGMFYFYMPFMQKLSQKYKVVFWDQRGAGGSRGNISKNSITISQFVKDMDVVYNYIKALYPDSDIYVMGHSYGGMVGGAYTSKFHDKIKASIFISPAFNIKSASSDMSTLMLQFINKLLTHDLSPNSRKLWNEALQFYQNNPNLKASDFVEHLKWTALRDRVLGIPQEEEFERSIIPILIQDNIVENLNFLQERNQILQALAQNSEHNRELSTDPEFNLKSISHPVFVAVGIWDAIVSSQTSIQGYDSLNNGSPNPSSILYYMPNTSHFAFVQPIKDQLLERILLFIDQN
ncbi:MAG: alpha/beta fold hydrolase [Brevinema sp.]